MATVLRRDGRGSWPHPPAGVYHNQIDWIAMRGTLAGLLLSSFVLLLFPGSGLLQPSRRGPRSEGARSRWRQTSSRHLALLLVLRLIDRKEVGLSLLGQRNNR